MQRNPIAIFYDQLFGDQQQDFQFYKYFIGNGKSLEIGSGTGRLFLEYLKLGFDVEGIEPNNDMIEICKAKSKRLNLKPIIYQQSLENLSLEKKFNTIYMPLFVFQNIINQESANRALKNCYDSLEQNGQVLISIFIPWNDPTGTWENTWRIRKISNLNDKTLMLSESVNFDKFEQIETKFLKFEEFNKNNELENSFFSTIQYKAYSINELRLLLKQSGFKNIEIFGDYTLQEANGNTEIFIFKANK